MHDASPATEALVGAAQRVSRVAKAGLMLASLALFVFEHLVRQVMGLMALVGILDAVPHPVASRSGHARQLLLSFPLWSKSV